MLFRSKYYATHPENEEKRQAYQRKLNKKKSQVEYREELTQKRRELKIYGKSKEGGKAGLDVGHKKAHKDGGTLKDGYRLEKPKVNRGRK